ncbi:Flp pilus assembly protein CpaB [Microvirga arsenatis]|uniref:Flp pilus assembly protein CpaB n=1 Tax=Microvirga arsenatis TaxID=2692265 RepID=A0ABW9YXG7_9HYPH|nr:Flp pilus assembly protein CpaB [Microvirga arsenatis]NBJ10559.1 Flp pilus assembly protein CpaB [Microvirga arsenatis]NBJ24542.1 Flp pilus assembly protein CpaB [Microvirga arsenatis]
MLRIVLLIVALGAGILAGWLALSLRPSAAVATVEPPRPQVKMTEILVAAADLPLGQPLDEKAFRWQAWPADAIGAGFITRAAQPDAVKALNGLLVRNPFISGEPIREEKLSRSSNLLASLLTPGKRAVAIRISAESTAGGFILPNDRVDVIHTGSRTAEGQKDNVSRTLLSNIRVLAVDQNMVEAKGKGVAVGKTATLELSPAEAEVIATAQASGSLSLALRSVADIRDETLPKTPTNPSVRVLRAGQSEFVKF